MPFIFTDEPQFARPLVLPYAESTKPATIVWTDGLREMFKEKYGEDILSRLPELFWDNEEGNFELRYKFRAFTLELFTDSFFKQCGEWCRNHNISFTGHDFQEDTLKSQTECLGEAMRTYQYFDIPGIDILCDAVELQTAKQCQSIVHQFGKKGMMSELYGVTGWEFDFRGHKFQGDWQAALGVTYRVPHLSWYSMKGAAKRDFPASLSYQSAWYREYSYMEDHFARLSYILSKGKPVVKVGVIHPVESMWLNLGPIKDSSMKIQQAEKDFKSLNEWLIGDFIDFDFISESVLPQIYKQSEDLLFKAGEMSYEAILVPPIDTIRKSTLDSLKEFQDKGGKIVWAGNCPRYTDGRKSDMAKEVYQKSMKISFNRKELISSLKEQKEIDLRNSDGEILTCYAYTMREEKNKRWLFIARTVKPENKCYAEGMFDLPNNVVITLKGEYRVKIYDTLSGEIKEADYFQEKGNTVIRKTLFSSDSLLLELEKGKGGNCEKNDKRDPDCEIDIKQGVDYNLSEDNVLVLDMAEWSLDGKQYYDEEELLRIDAYIRKKSGMPASDGLDIQPWVMQEEDDGTEVYLKFNILSDTDCFVNLAFEEAEEVILNGKKIEITREDYFTDKRIYKMPLGDIVEGRNQLIIKTKLTKRITLENYFLTGNFGVYENGCECRITKMPEKVCFGNLANQGFAFYGANITYKIPFESENCDVKVNCSKYSGAVIKAVLDGEDCGKIAFSPYELTIKNVKKGKHELALTLYITRVNTFGALHCAREIDWKGARCWYAQGQEWAYEYQLKENGILKSPVIKFFNKKGESIKNDKK